MSEINSFSLEQLGSLLDLMRSKGVSNLKAFNLDISLDLGYNPSLDIKAPGRAPTEVPEELPEPTVFDLLP